MRELTVTRLAFHLKPVDVCRVAMLKRDVNIAI